MIEGRGALAPLPSTGREPMGKQGENKTETRGKPLWEQWRPATWDDVVGQDKVVAQLRRMGERAGLAGRSYWIAGQSGTGKTTIARLIAAAVASEWDTEEIDAGALTCASLRECERLLSYRGM